MERFDVIVLAAQRTGVINELAEKHSESHKCLVPIVGIPLIERVLTTLTSHPNFNKIVIVIEEDGQAALQPLVEKYSTAALPIEFVTSNENIAGSVLAASKAVQAPFLITTADNVLLTHESLDKMMMGLEDGADALLALAARPDVLAVHPEAQKNFYEMRCGAYANCNLYAIRGEKALAAVEVFRSGGQFMKNPTRLIRVFGIWNIIQIWRRRLTLQQAGKRLSKRFGVDIRAVTLSDGSQAVDVDNERTYKIVEIILSNKK
ncbi:NTP transferase domain-containing protein [Parasphingorhabdus sp.]|uniref:NTP transferase domain-containing protein n=1 Tax=Parasphingorhabdus sp. TaxID=2709688 RepID=UPI003265E2DC